MSGVAGGTERREDTGSNDGGGSGLKHIWATGKDRRPGIGLGSRRWISHRSQLLQTQTWELDDGGPRTPPQLPAVSSALQRL